VKSSRRSTIKRRWSIGFEPPDLNSSFTFIEKFSEFQCFKQ
jgi:hypothetical protein